MAGATQSTPPVEAQRLRRVALRCIWSSQRAAKAPAPASASAPMPSLSASLLGHLPQNVGSARRSRSRSRVAQLRKLPGGCGPSQVGIKRSTIVRGQTKWRSSVLQKIRGGNIFTALMLTNRGSNHAKTNNKVASSLSCGCCSWREPNGNAT